MKILLSPEKAAGLIELPTGCLEQTMVTLAPLASAIRYLDLSEQWVDLPIGARDDALDKLEKGRTCFHVLCLPFVYVESLKNRDSESTNFLTNREH